MTGETLRLAAEWMAERRPFAIATVVWRMGPSSGKTGSQALIRPDGTMEGWLGGACAEPTVVREALAALTDGEPRLLQLGHPEEFGSRPRSEVVSVPMACESEGAMEVYVQPVLPAPRLVVVGRSPAAETLVAMGATLGWRTALEEDAGGGLALGDLGERDFVVVATQGHYDEAALEAVLATKAGYVGLIASAKRAGSVLEYLRDRGVADEALARIHAPAGMDLGKVDHQEMAVSVLAELVALKAAGGISTGVAIEPPESTIDPVCGMTVEIATAHHTGEHEGMTYYFCAAGCQKAFAANPAAFVGRGAP